MVRESECHGELLPPCAIREAATATSFQGANTAPTAALATTCPSVTAKTEAVIQQADSKYQRSRAPLGLVSQAGAMVAAASIPKAKGAEIMENCALH